MKSGHEDASWEEITDELSDDGMIIVDGQEVAIAPYSL
jgi:hypothetical protein